MPIKHANLETYFVNYAYIHNTHRHPYTLINSNWFAGSTKTITLRHPLPELSPHRGWCLDTPSRIISL
jgi:hypothetical protein